MEKRKNQTDQGLILSIIKMNGKTERKFQLISDGKTEKLNRPTVNTVNH